jgi:hypothetical protein
MPETARVMPRLSRIVTPLAITLVSVAAHAARQDGLVVYMTFDDANEPLKNLAPLVPGREPIEPTKIGDGLEAKFSEGRYGKAALFNAPPVPKSSGTTTVKPVLTKDWAVSLGKLDDVYAGSFTVSCWINIPVGNPGVIIGNKESFTIASGWNLSSRYGQHYLIQPFGGSALEGFTVGLEKKWRNVVYVVNRSTGAADIFVDGKKEKSFKLPSADTKLGEGLATVIGASATGTYGTQCSVDEVGIWNRALSEAEITALGSGKRIPEASSYAWAGLGVSAATAAIIRRRRARKA